METKWKRMILFAIIAVVILISVNAETSMNFLTKGFADTLYCPIVGGCNITVVNSTQLCVNSSCVDDWSAVNISTNFSDSFVPYNGSIGNVDLNDKNLSLDTINSSEKCVNNSCIKDWSAVNTSTSGFVPYVNATQDVKIDDFNLSAQAIQVDVVESRDIAARSRIEFVSGGNVTIWI